MGARHKINEFHIIGSLAAAGFLGLITGSLTVFILASAVLIGAAIHSGDIRYKSQRHNYRGHRR